MQLLSLTTIMIPLAAVLSFEASSKRIAGPAFLYCATWFVVYFLFTIGLLDYYSLSIKALGLMLFGHMSFVAGTILVTELLNPKKTSSITGRSISSPMVGIMVPFLLLAFGLGLYLSHYYYDTYNVLGAWVTGIVNRKYILEVSARLLSEGGLAAMLGGIGGVLLHFCSIYAAVYLVRRGQKKSFAGDIYVLTILACVLYYTLVTIAKAPIVLFVLQLLLVYILVNEQGLWIMRISTIKRLGALALAILFLCSAPWTLNFLYENIRNEKNEVMGNYLSEDWLVKNFLLRPVLYLTISTACYSYWVGETERKATTNISFENTFPPISKWLHRLGLKRKGFEQTVYKKYVYTPYVGNTYTWFYSFQRDFGVAGIFLMPFLIGSLVSYFYIRAKSYRSFYTLFVYILLLQNCILSFFHWSFVSTSQYLIMLYAILLGWMDGKTKVIRSRNP